MACSRLVHRVSLQHKLIVAEARRHSESQTAVNVVVAGDSIHIAEVARRFAPHLHIVSIAQPEPVLRERNVVTMVPAAEDAGDSVLSLEAMAADDAAIGVVLMGSEPADDGPSIGPEAATTTVAPRILVGGLLAAVVGALVVGAAAALLSDGPGVIGAMVGGAALFGPFGATWAGFGRRGDSDGYGQPFVEPHPADLAVVSYHTDDEAQADAGFERLRAHGHRNIVILDASGSHVLRRNDGS